MAYKKGGGNKLQLYDESTGQYDEETKARINEEDKKALVLVHYFGVPYNELSFHFPIYGLHDDEYCDIFVKYARKVIKRFDIDNDKMIYLLKYHSANDKSEFLNKIGYSSDNPDELCSDIYCHTDVQTLTFTRYKKGYLGCIAKTTLKGKVVTSVWSLEKNFHIRFITIIPGGDKRWK